MNPPEAVTVSAPSRLHFGLMSFGGDHERQFGGIGAMIDRPRFVLTARRSEQFEARGPLSELVAKYAERVLAHLGRPEFPATFTICEAPRTHVGLGTGTQIGLSVAKALSVLLEHDMSNSLELAKAAGRGARSAVGTHGFQTGGLVFEEGKRSSAEVAPVAARVELPQAWRFMLVIPGDSEGLSGARERRAFEQLPPVPYATRQTLYQIATEEILPAARAADIDAFGDAVYEYGHLAGTCFASEQHGPYATQLTQHIVDSLRGVGFRGVGQSSWGPTVFAVVRESETEHAMKLVRDLLPKCSAQTVIATPDALGALTDIHY